MKVIIFGATGMVGQAVLRECLRDEAVDSWRVKAAFNPWANRLFEILSGRSKVYVVSISRVR